MAEINFGSNTQGFERFSKIFHVASALLCVLMGGFALFQQEHYAFLPPIFIIAALLCGVNCYGGFLRVRHKKNRSARIAALLYGVLMLVLAGAAYLSIRLFWL